jgi:hypothetical protein
MTGKDDGTYALKKEKYIYTLSETAGVIVIVKVIGRNRLSVREPIKQTKPTKRIKPIKLLNLLTFPSHVSQTRTTKEITTKTDDPRRDLYLLYPPLGNTGN